MNPGQAVAGVFSQPGKTFEALVARPTWWLPFVLLIAAVGGSILAATPKIDYEKTGARVPETQINEAAERSKKFAWLGAPIGTVFVAVVFFAVAGILWGSAKAFGGELGYSQMLAIYGHSGLPNVGDAILSIPIFLTQADSSLSQQAAQRVVMSNLGAFLPADTAPALLAAASSLDVFALWSLALLVIGFRRIPALSRGSATAIPIVLWGVWVA
ncbi:MAG TPA: YIP1 family protein, partial [Thermoanaerobaculia bacterium]